MLEVISEGWRNGFPWEILFSDVLVVLIADSDEELQEKWETWYKGLAKKGFKVNIKKLEVLVSSRNQISANITDNRNNTILKQVGECKYLGMTVSEEVGLEMAARARVKAAWTK